MTKIIVTTYTNYEHCMRTAIRLENKIKNEIESNYFILITKFSRNLIKRIPNVYSLNVCKIQYNNHSLTHNTP